MITDPLPENHPKPRPPRGLPEVPPPGFIMREGKSPILVYSERLRDWLRGRLRRENGEREVE